MTLETEMFATIARWCQRSPHTKRLIQLKEAEHSLVDHEKELEDQQASVALLRKRIARLKRLTQPQPKDQL